MERRAYARAVGLYALIVALAVASWSCTSGPTLTRSSQEGKISISGSSFKPNEQVTVHLTGPGGKNSTLVLNADAKGTFQVQTEFAEGSASEVQVRAQGNQGSEALSR